MLNHHKPVIFFLFFFSDGKMVIAFGLNVFTGEHYPTNQVIIFDTVSNTMYNQSVSGVAPPIKAYASSSLGIYYKQIVIFYDFVLISIFIGPDQTSIYYHGGYFNVHFSIESCI